MATPTIMLVHGAFADASGWAGVATDLVKDGFTVACPAVPLRGPSDNAYISSLAAQVDGPVLLVGHSYGCPGFVRGSAAAGTASGRAGMRGRWTLGAAIVVAAALTTAGTAGAATRGVNGSMSGPGGFRSASCSGGTADEIGSGSYAATALGIGKYSFDACITQTTSGFAFSGTAKFVTRSGAQLRGTIGGTFSGSGNPSFTVQVKRGTKRFVRATGALVLGPFATTNETNCQHGLCIDFTATGPVRGTLHHVIKH